MSVYSSDRNQPGAYVHQSAYVDEGALLGAGTKVWHFSHIYPDAVIGQNCIIGQNVMIGSGVKIGNNCKIQNNVSIYQGVELEDDVFCGPSCVFTNVSTPRSFIEKKSEFKRTVVRRGASIGANATIICGNTLGKYCSVGAGAVVTKDLLPYSLNIGVPSRRVGWVSKAGEKLDSNLQCPKSGARYCLTRSGELEEAR